MVAFEDFSPPPTTSSSSSSTKHAEGVVMDLGEEEEEETGSYLAQHDLLDLQSQSSTNSLLPILSQDSLK